MSDLPVDLTVGAPTAPEVVDDIDGQDDWDGPLEEQVAGPVSDASVRGLLAGMGAVLAVAVGSPDVERHWRFTDAELDDLTPPIARVVNKRPRLRAAVERGDEALIAVHLAGYVGRNVAAGRTHDDNLTGEDYGTAGPGDAVHSRVDRGAGPGGENGVGVRGGTTSADGGLAGVL